ncbi:hypothetical protein EST92_12110 [Streptomyces sp. TM32]|uniref:hypothetical protein n=1 Tax=Streptomyces sp. TM32 TaxID=1652669 RepID=UPI00101089DB|nr:hypothetical protein [Streptomyces sp. TM32]RXS84077.1 hypothetical protein EST92_12110 [Streptomyces sp. TM32]
MEQPMSGPEPEAPAPAGPGEPEERVEPEDGGAGEAAGAGAAGPQPLGVGVTPTGQPAVDARLRRLADADHLPADGHLPVYEDVHRGLRDVLAALDQHPGPPAPSSTFSTPHDNRS